METVRQHDINNVIHKLLEYTWEDVAMIYIIQAARDARLISPEKATEFATTFGVEWP